MPIGATDWLRSMGHPDARSEPLAERVSAPEEASGVPDWLRDMSEDEVSRAVEAEVPKTQPRFDPEVSGWLVEDTPGPDASTVSANWMARSTPSDETSDQAPDWLQEAVAAEASEAERGGPAQTPPSNLAGSAEMPAWLRDLGGAEDASEEELPADADDEPAWLRDAANRPPTDRLAGHADEVEVPAWLRDFAEPTAGAPVAAPQASAAPPLPPAPSGEAVPSWLEAVDAPPSAPSGEAVPAWLRDAAPPAAPEPTVRPRAGDVPAPPPAANDNAMPSWLRDTAGTTPPESPAWLQAGDVPAPPPATGGNEVPAWLRAADAPVPPPATGGNEVPAWLRAADAPVPPPATGGSEVPAWLRASDAPAPPPATGGNEVPAWLREADAPAPPPATGGSEVPAWLREADAPAPPPATGGSEVPAWLREADAPAPSPATGGSEVPTWLREADAPAPPPATGGNDEVPAWLQEAERPPLPPVPDAMPAWLQENSPPPDPTWLREAVADPAAAAGSPAEVQAWLQASTDQPAATEVPPPRATEPPAANDLPPWLITDETPASDVRPSTPTDAGLPSWLQGVTDTPPVAPKADAPAPPPPPRQAQPAAEQGESNSFFTGAELPSWLRPSEPERPVANGESQALDWLRQLGSAEQEEEVQQATVATVAVARRPQYTRTAEQMTAIGLLQRISRTPYPVPVIPAVATPPTIWQRIGLDRVLYLLLTLALLVALLLPTLTTPFQTATPPDPTVAELGAKLDSLNSNAVVLVAYEWGAQRSSELRPLEAAVTKRLIANKTKLILVSTDMQGTLLSFDLVGPLRAAGYNNENGVNFGGRDYVLLGYRPGGELALRSMAQDFRAELRSDFDGQDATQSLVANLPDNTPRFTGISDLSMIIVMADQPQDVQAWMEQVYPMAREVPLVFLLPQEAQPLVQPYLRLPNVYHLAGLQGTLALTGSDPQGDSRAVARSTGQLWFAVVVFLVLLAGGSVVALVSRQRTARTRGGAA